MRIEDQIKVMEAFTNGKQIEVRPLSGGEWRAEGDPSWNWGNLVYRVVTNLDDSASNYASTYNSNSLRAAIRKAYKAGYDERVRVEKNKGVGRGR